MSYTFIFEKRVEFSETDLAGILHFSNMFSYMEMAEHAFYRSLGLTVVDPGNREIGWPRVHVSCDFFAPLSFEEIARIQLFVKEKRAKSVHYLFKIDKVRGDRLLRVATGESSAVCVEMKSGKMVARALPAAFDKNIETAPENVLREHFQKKEASDGR